MATNLQFIKSVSGSDVSIFNITNCFSSSYDVYQINIVEYINDDLSDFFAMRFIDSGGNIISDTEYAYANLNMRSYTSFSQNKSASTSEINNIGYSQSNSISSTANNIINAIKLATLANTSILAILLKCIFCCNNANCCCPKLRIKNTGDK